jgi:serine/threonine protein phosphatase PrpC
MAVTNSDTDTSSGSTPSSAPHAEPRREITVDISGLSDRGLRRDQNEDHFLISRLDRTWQMLQSNLEPGALPPSSQETVYGMIVADGMGGHAGGEVASRMAITKFVEYALRTPNLFVRLDPQTAQETRTRMSQRFEAVKDALVRQADRDSGLTGMGTTMTMACIFNAELLVAHVGDSRAYLYRRGHLVPLTRDQTMAQEMLETGLISESDLASNPLRHVLTGVLGTQGTPISTEVRAIRLENGDQILLCSDGLTEMVDDTAIAKVIGEPGVRSARICEQLVSLANAHGGRDNITVIAARYQYE